MTLALDELLARGHPLTETIIIHLAPRGPQYHHALQKLTTIFTNDSYQGTAMRFRMLPILIGRHPIADLYNEAALDAASYGIHQLIQQLKELGAVIHLCATGGRRLLGMLAISAAMQYFDQHDRIWHLYSSDTERAVTHQGARLHRTPESEIALLRVPLAIHGPARQIEPAPPIATLPAEEYERCRSVIDRLSLRQRDVLRAIADGLEIQEIAARLSITVATVHQHKSAIFSECRNCWGSMPEHVKLYWVRDRFAPFFSAYP